MIYDFFNIINPVAWVLSNLLVIYIGVVLVVFVTLYYLYFDIKATTGGRFIFRFSLSLIGVIGLIFIGFFVDPAQGREWFNYPGDPQPWRPLSRLLVYSYVSYTTTSLAILIHMRRWHPNKLRTIRDRQMLDLKTDKY